MTLHTARDRALEIAEQIGTLGPISVTRFFSGAGLVAAGVQFGFVIKSTLYLRVDDKNRLAYEALGAAPFSYAGRSKTVTVASYYEAPAEIIEDADELGRWAADAHRAALAARLPRRPAKSRPRRKTKAGKAKRGL